MTIVLVGGPADGHNVTLPEGTQIYEYASVRPMSLVIDAYPDQVIADKHVYILFPLSPETPTKVFAYLGEKPQNVLQLLIEGYRK